MKRKVIKQGHNTLTITLPAKWVERNNVKAGDELNLEDQENHILINRASKENSKKSLTINLDSEDQQFIRLVLNNIYRRGIDILTIRFKTDKQFEHIQEISNSNFLGFEIIKRGTDSCILENIAEPTDIDLAVLMRRIMLIIKETFVFLESDFAKEDYNSFNYIIQQSKKIEQFDNYCKRLINKGTLNKTSDSYFYWLFLYYLLLIGRAFFHLYSFVDQKKKLKISKQTITVLTNLRKSYCLFYDSFYKKDICGIEKSNKQIKNILFNDLYDLLSSTKGAETVVVHWIAEITRFMSLFISPSLEICLCLDVQES